VFHSGDKQIAKICLYVRKLIIRSELCDSKKVCDYVASAGRSAYCCGSCSLSAARRTRLFLSKSSSVCCVTDIAWRSHLTVHLNCKCIGSCGNLFSHHALLRSAGSDRKSSSDRRRVHTQKALNKVCLRNPTSYEISYQRYQDVIIGALGLSWGCNLNPRAVPGGRLGEGGDIAAAFFSETHAGLPVFNKIFGMRVLHRFLCVFHR